MASKLKKITAISPQKRRRGRVNIFLDEEFWSGASVNVVADIAVGDELDEEALLELERKIVEGDAFAWAAHYLSRWPRTVAAFRQKALTRGYSEQIVDKMVKMCIEYSYLNDDILASNLIERGVAGGRSRQWLRSKLMTKQFDDELSRKSLEEYPEAEALKNAIQHLRHVDDEKKMQRLLGRGFSYQACREEGIKPPAPKFTNQELEEEAIEALADKAWERYQEVSNKSISWLVRRGVGPGVAIDKLREREKAS